MSEIMIFLKIILVANLVWLLYSVVSVFVEFRLGADETDVVVTTILLTAVKLPEVLVVFHSRLSLRTSSYKQKVLDILFYRDSGLLVNHIISILLKVRFNIDYFYYNSSRG